MNRTLVPLLLLAAVVQAFYNTTLPLSGDEAYYWCWAKALAAGYHDHPPGIALAIAATTALFGDTVFGVRLAAVVCMTGAVWFIAALARDLAGERAAWVTALLMLALPAVQMGYTLAVPDGPLVLTWAAGVWFGRRAVAGEGRWADFLAAGLCAGAAMGSKYTGVLLPASLALFVLLRRRDLLLNARLWAAGLAALAVFSPVLWWNWAHGFESFAFQYKHGSGASLAVHWGDLGAFLGGQVLVLSPVVLFLLLRRAARWREWWSDDRQTFLMIAFLAPMALFLEKALFAKIQLNWAVPVYLSVLPLIAAGMTRRGLIIAAVPAVLLSLAVKLPLLLGLHGNLNPQNRLFGPDQAVTAVQALRRPGDAIFADHLQRASLLRFYLPDHPGVSIPTQSRFSEFTRWDQGKDFSQAHGLYLSEGEHKAELAAIFGQADLIEMVTAQHPGGRPQTYYIYRVGGA